MSHLVKHTAVILSLFGLAQLASAQSVTLSIGSTSAAAGATVSLPITVATAGATQPAGLQWSFAYSQDIVSVTVAAGASATSAGKTISCAGTTCIVSGDNDNLIPAGMVAVATVKISSNPSSSSIPIQMAGVVLTTAAGAPIPATGASGVITTAAQASVFLTGLACTNATINTPGSTPCTVSLNSAAPTGGFAVSLSSNNTSASVPSSVTVAAGQTAGSFTATATQTETNQAAAVTATAGGVSFTSTLNLIASATQLAGVVCAPATLGSNSASSCTVSLNRAASSSVTVAISSNNTSLAVPASVSIAAGGTSGTFSATTHTVSGTLVVTVTATLSGLTKATTVTLAPPAQPRILACSPSNPKAPGTTTCTLTLVAVAPAALTVELTSNNTNAGVPASVSVPARRGSASFMVNVLPAGAGQSATLKASANGTTVSTILTLGGATTQAQICQPGTKCATVASARPTTSATAGDSAPPPSANCAEFRTTADGECMLQDLIPWVAFGAGWESRLNIGDVNTGVTGGPVKVGFSLTPPMPMTNGAPNYITAFYADSRAVPNTVREGASSSYALSLGQSVNVRFLYAAAGCDIHGANCDTVPDPNMFTYGTLSVTYVADDPGYLRGLTEATVTLSAPATGTSSAWQAVETEEPAAAAWKSTVRVSANQAGAASFDAFAAVANPGTQAVNLAAILYDQNGSVVASKNFAVPGGGMAVLDFSQEPNGASGGFGAAMFPQGADFNGSVVFGVTSPDDGAITTLVLQRSGSAFSAVSVQAVDGTVVPNIQSAPGN